VNPPRKWTVRAIYLFLFAALIGSITQYSGSKLIFSSFAVVTFAIGYLAIRFSTQYAHLFLGIAWFIGFWVKCVFHQATGSPYYELYGSFDGSNASWDAVFVVVAIGGAGYLAGRLISIPVVAPITASLFKRTIIVPSWWISYRNVAWVGAGLLVFSTLVLNHAFGLLTRGYVASVVLPWPLGGLYAWMTDIGFALVLSLLLAWDRQSNQGIMRGFVALCIEGALFSVSTLSRGVFFFHTLPPLVSEGGDYVKRGKILPTILLLATWALVGTAIPSATTFLRLFGENAVPTTAHDLVTSESSNISRPMMEQQTASGLWNQFVTMSRLLVIDRWTGLEGVMATVAYPEKSRSLLAEAATQRRSYGTVDVYTKKISGSTFNEENAKKYHYATLAGPIAFLYFSGSLGIVFVGMALISILMSATELLWLWLARDRLLVAMSGCYLALIVLQLSGGLVQAVTGLLTVTVVFVGVWLLDWIYGRRQVASKMTLQVPPCSQS
jgi:hypothetical protein